MPIKNWPIYLATISLYSCSPALVNLPPAPFRLDCPVQEAPQCPRVNIDLPPQIPFIIRCDINKDKGIIKADKGCEELIRNYAAIRKAIKQWHDGY